MIYAFIWREVCAWVSGELCDELEAAEAQVSLSTVKQVLHCHRMKGFCPEKKTLLKNQHFQAWLKFAAQWFIVRWGQQCVWGSQDEAFTIKPGGSSILLWHCFAASGPGLLHKVDGIMKVEDYHKILQHGLKLIARQLTLTQMVCVYIDIDSKTHI